MTPASRFTLPMHWRSALIIGFCAVLFGALSSPVDAATVCCDCRPKGDTKKTCLTIDATKLQNADNCSTLPADAKLPEGWTCEAAKLLPSACKKIVSGTTSVGGVCSTDPASAFSIAANAVAKSTASTAKPAPPIAFALNVPIPGFAAQTSVDGNLFGQYLYAIFRYAISIAVVAATIMFIYGAFRYLVGSAVGGISRGKEIMTDAVIGLLLLISSTMILRTLNPELVKLDTLEVQNIKTVVYTNPYVGTEVAPDILAELGQLPSGGRIPDYTIPSECPGRNPSAPGPNAYRALSYRGASLTPEIIEAYLAEQRATGIPAAVLIAQMMTETGRAGPCIALNLFKNPTVCSQSAFVKYFNFGGVGCTQAQVPSNACAHLGFAGPAGLGAPPGKTSSVNLTAAQVNEYWNKSISPACIALANDPNVTRDNYTNCGDKCFPLKSHTTVRVTGQSKDLWIPTIMCSRKFENAHDFLATHTKAVKACLSYNDSVYSFAYCVGASMYASASDKGKILADIIERNCLCDPEKDSRKCVRDRELEQDITNAVVSKTNLFTLYSAGKLDEAAQDRVVKKLYEKTGGRLVPLPMEAGAINDAEAIQ